MHTSTFIKCINIVASVLPKHKQGVYLNVNHLYCTTNISTEFHAGINSKSGGIIITPLSLRILKTREQAICTIAHEAGHYVYDDWKTYFFTDDQGRFDMEVRADLYAREVCIKLGLNLNKCASLYKLFDDGGVNDNYCYPLTKERQEIILNGVIPEFRGVIWPFIGEGYED